MPHPFLVHWLGPDPKLVSSVASSPPVELEEWIFGSLGEKERKGWKGKGVVGCSHPGCQLARWGLDSSWNGNDLTQHWQAEL